MIERPVGTPPSLSVTAREVRAGVFSELQARIDARAARGEDLVPLHIGDTFIDPPPSSALGFDTDAALFRYGATAALPALRRAIAARAARDHGVIDLDPDREILVGVGATHAIACALRCVIDPGDQVLLAAPYWPLAHGILKSVGADVIEVPLTDRMYRDPSLDVGAILREELSPRTRAIYLITPNNPDGKVWSRVHLEQVAAVAEEHDLWVLADEVYADYAFEAPHVSFASLPGMRSRTITAGSFSKSHALAGARVGYVSAPAELIAAARKISTHSVFNVPVVCQRAALGAIEAPASWIASARDQYRHARDATAHALEGSGIDFALAEGGTYLFLDCARILRDRPLLPLMEAALDRGVLLAPGEAFGRAYAKHARLCYSAAPLPRVLEGVRRLRAAIDAIAR